MKNRKLVLALMMSAPLLATSAAHAVGYTQGALMDVMAGTTISPSLVTLSTMCTVGIRNACRGADETLVEEAMEFRSTGKMTVELREKLDLIRDEIKAQNLDVSLPSDEELSRMIIEAKEAEAK